MAKNDGRFKKGERRSPATEFKKGQHWRAPQPFREREYLLREYVEKKRSTGDIAAEFGTTDGAILFWLRKHNIPRRSISEARALKHWGAVGEANGMSGKRGAASSNWKGGCTPERQSFYTSQKWASAASLVWKRDKAACQRCGLKHSAVNRLHVHHIVSFKVRELRAEPSNLVLLCVKCHRWAHSKRNVDKVFIKELEGG